MKRKLLIIVTITLWFFQSCSSQSREVINTYFGVGLKVKDSRTKTLNEIERIELGKDFIYLFEKNSTNPRLIYAKSQVQAIYVNKKPE